MALAITIVDLVQILVGLYGGSLGAIVASRKGSLGAGLLGAGILLMVAHTFLDFGGAGFVDLAASSAVLGATALGTAAIHRLWAGHEVVADAQARARTRVDESRSDVADATSDDY